MGTPHRLRHSGPSHDVLHGRRTLEEIRRRGRWVSQKSVQRYTKTHVLVERESIMSDEQLKRGKNLWKNLPQFLSKASAGQSDAAANALRAAARKYNLLKQKSG